MTLEFKANQLEKYLVENNISKQAIGRADLSPYNKEEKLYVYLAKRDWTTKKIPDVFMDVPVIVSVIGKIEVRT